MVLGDLQLDFFQFEYIYKVVVNTLLVSIPEEIYFVLFTYIMMGEFDQWKDEDCKKLFQPWDYARILVPAVFAAIVSNMIRYSGAHEGFITSGTLFAMILGIVAMGDIRNNARAAKWVREVFQYILLCAVCSGVIELLYLPFVVYGSGMSLVSINNNIMLNFILSIPAKLMECSLLFFVVMRKSTAIKEWFVRIIVESKVLSMLSFIILMIDALFLFLIMKLVSYDEILFAFSTESRLIAIVGIYIFLVLNILAMVLLRIRENVKNEGCRGI